jgi:N4-gp56 family major capsid protein
VLNDILDAMTRLTITRAPMLNGEYVFVVGPQVARDILADPKVLLAGQYGTSKSLMTGEIGRWYGVRIVKHTNPFIEDGSGSEGVYVAAPTAANAIYRSFAMGTDGFGIPQMGGLSPFNPQMMICDKPDKSDPTNRFITAGLKTYWCSVVLNATWIVSVSSKSAFAG